MLLHYLNQPVNHFFISTWQNAYADTWKYTIRIKKKCQYKSLNSMRIKKFLSAKCPVWSGICLSCGRRRRLYCCIAIVLWNISGHPVYVWLYLCAVCQSISSVVCTADWWQEDTEWEMWTTRARSQDRRQEISGQDKDTRRQVSLNISSVFYCLQCFDAVG